MLVPKIAYFPLAEVRHVACAQSILQSNFV